MTIVSTSLMTIAFAFSTASWANSPTSAYMFLNSATPEIEPPPAAGSAQEQAEFRELYHWQKNRTLAQCEAAGKESTLYLRTFVGSRVDLLSRKEELQLMKNISILQLKVTAIAMDYKNRFNRLRPYMADTKVQPCIALENSSSYPSGHAANAYAIAEALGAIFPARAKLFLERAQEVAFNRVLGGVHFRSDIVAGEQIGRYYGKKLLRSK